MTRRHVVLRIAAAYSASRLPLISNPSTSQAEIEIVLARIRRPEFPDRDFPITDYGAVGDGTRKCTEAIRKAVVACSAAGGGRVVVPNGTFLTGAIHLENNVNLYVAEGATLLFSTDPNDYLPLVFTRFASTECMNFSPLVYAFEKQNVAITGSGLLDGQADERHWWDWTRKALGGGSRGEAPDAQNDVKTLVEEMGDKDAPVKHRIFGPGHYLRPNFVQPYRCQNVLLEGFTIKRSPMWELNPTLCRNVTVRNVTIDSHGPNNDGCDPDACTDVLIEKCKFSTGDDCIAIKSGRNRDGRRVGVSTTNVIVQDCVMADGHGGVSIGSEVSGGIKNIYVRRNRMSSPNLQRALRIKTNSYRGGTIENVIFADTKVGQVSDAVVTVDFYYEEGEGGPFKPVVKDIFVQNVTCERSKYGIYLNGYKNDPITGLTVSNSTFNNAGKGNFFRNVEGVKFSHFVVNGREVSPIDLNGSTPQRSQFASPAGASFGGRFSSSL